jgi:hypothetical protein
MNLAHALRLLAVSIAALACAMPAAAQWAWRDAAGRMVYSDQPPPKSVPAKDVLRQPGMAPPRSGTAADVQGDVRAEAKAPAESTTPPARPAAPTVTEREIESRRRQQQMAETEKKAADEEARKAQVAENCERMRGYLRALEGGFRVARVNAAGQQEILDEAARAAERERTRAQIEQHCQ